MSLSSEPSVRPETDPFEVGVDDDFIFYLQKGSEYLRGGRSEDARVALERAYELRPDNARAQNLLGLAYFKLGLLEAAKAVYDRLVNEYPNEAPLCVNLGLVLLRQGRLHEARGVLERALDLSPDHVRAHCYLGLVLYRIGDFHLAREHFIKGEAPDFARKVETKMADEDTTDEVETPRSVLSGVAEDGVEKIDHDAASFATVDESKDSGVRDDAGWTTKVGHQPQVQQGFAIPSLLSVIAAAPVAPDTEDLPKLSPAQSTDPPPPVRPSSSIQVAAKKAALPLVEPGPRMLEGPGWVFGFSAGQQAGNTARLRLSGDAYLRASTIAAAAGQVTYRAAAKRERGELTEVLLGGVKNPFFASSGEARILLHVRGLAVTLRDAEDLVAREDVLCGFHGFSSYENDRLYGVDLVRLSGKGSVLFDSPGEPVITPVRKELPVAVVSSALLAFGGQLRSRTVQLTSSGPLIEMSGTGYVVLAHGRSA